MGLCLMLP